MLIGNTIEIFFIKDTVMYGRAAFFALPSIYDFFSLFILFSFSFFSFGFLSLGFFIL